ncbi:related to ER glucosidase I [Cephalotrichum gorgonifer]|uniref:Mannosyl-oligosaccharide glucosidase n=1 Tax=Cephalotrichum gorgonifer TaxID=2041049 RepID=A0AAE8MWQ1_9PEZI|nr:related to ER glucosidase I [Cephalotrichum gorgonifer]
MVNTSRLAALLVASSCTFFQFGTVAAADADPDPFVEYTSHSPAAQANNQSMLWGPYKPNVYFGVRPRVAEGLWSSLMWANLNTYDKINKAFRYTCEQHQGLAGYGWDEYDLRRGGVETIRDEANQIDITVSFVKVDEGDHGGNWAARIKGVPRPDAPEDLITMIAYYIASESGNLDIQDISSGPGFEGNVAFTGASPVLGNYKLVVTKGKGNHPESSHELADERPLDLTAVVSAELPSEILWQAKQVAFKQLSESVKVVNSRYQGEQLPPPSLVYKLKNQPTRGNMQIVQKVFEGAFEFDVLFTSFASEHEMTEKVVTSQIESNTAAFNEKFSSVFELKAPFNDDKYKPFAKSMFSNLLGGVGYFEGHQLVDRSYASEYEEENEGFWEETAQARARKEEALEGPFELFTSVPSRPFFPRGFLWDEGFHLIPILDWDSDVALEIVKSWFSTMDEDGWIPREQILGPEPRSKVPEEFQVQYPHYANPPSLFLIIHSFTNALREKHGKISTGGDLLPVSDVPLGLAHLTDSTLGADYLSAIYPLLRRQYDWFRKTQRGGVRSYDREAFSSREAYRWRGRSEAHCLTSGLDDYPRPQPPHPGELHVDLMSWVGFMTKSLLDIADALGLEDDVAEYKKTYHAIQRNLADLHWSEKEGCFCDATIDDFEEHKLVCHKGYVSLFPFLVGLLEPNDPKLGRTLDLIGDEEHLFSEYGLRSLSKQDELYGTEENYWRSPIWINMNYLAIVQLRETALQDGPFKAKARDLYNRLRANVVNTVYASWVETGFAWEQYNPDTGKGQRTQHFTGWTSLVVKIMAMEELPAAAGAGAGAEGGARGEKDEL